MITGLGNFMNRHLGKSSDYTPLDEVANGSPGAAIGAGIGAAVGTAAGAAWGLHSLHTDTVSIATQRTEFMHPELVGAKYIPEDCTTNYTYDTDGNINGSYQSCDSPYWRAIVNDKPTGLIQERQHFQHTHWLGPISGALIGFGTGVVAGAIIGGLVGHLAEDQLSSPKVGVGDQAPVIGLAAGAVTGAAAGYYAGTVAQSKAQDLVQTVRTPLTTDQRIGWVPLARDYHDLRPQVDGSRQLFYRTQLGASEPYSGRKEVIRAVPTGEYRSQVETSKSYTLTPFKGALIGAGLGAVVGGLSGVAVGVLQKHLA